MTSRYRNIAIALYALLTLSVVVAKMDLGSAGTALAISIATAKAILVALFFMHLRSASRLVRLFAVAGLFWWGVLLGLTMGDFVHRI